MSESTLSTRGGVAVTFKERLPVGTHFLEFGSYLYIYGFLVHWLRLLCLEIHWGDNLTTTDVLQFSIGLNEQSFRNEPLGCKLLFALPLLFAFLFYVEHEGHTI